MKDFCTLNIHYKTSIFPTQFPILTKMKAKEKVTDVYPLAWPRAYISTRIMHSPKDGRWNVGVGDCH